MTHLTRSIVIAVAARIIPTTRPPVHQKPRLLTGQIRKRTAVRSRNAEGEFRRRNEERELLRELSRYYPLGKGQNSWTRLSLLQRSKHGMIAQPANDLPLTWIFLVLRDLEDIPDPQGIMTGHLSVLRRHQRP